MRETDKFIFFWGNEDIYSNFHYSPFFHRGMFFRWSEQAVMYRKALHFGAGNIAKEILLAKTPDQCKRLGRSRKIKFVEEEWVSVREIIYKEVLMDKFSTDDKFRKEILKTGDKVLVEASPFDKIWGIGYRDNHPYATVPEKWRGLNLLGKVLMEVREELKESDLDNHTLGMLD